MAVAAAGLVVVAEVELSRTMLRRWSSSLACLFAGSAACRAGRPRLAHRRSDVTSWPEHAMKMRFASV